ncbi:hypothetical protein P175DRAFT_049088 [Aspergillus ochraceoroseus IBT 24754]|uniref:YggU family protein n=1 Tax=Aspergillus ochraceoroseus IBT 24754 TaxID=1392256 RepID=A0A2T5M882_9EURO|nr:uncharacterized protein P175DRAFT_049088 [Aspergillus ochraceoroseus IBT 24754]PTU24749.1 hypothetical protein P175DRAFT_049088 [Aspergillus ochraceoroseus IBT 24754]
MSVHPLFRLIGQPIPKSSLANAPLGMAHPRLNTLYISCRVQPNTAGRREGISLVGAEKVGVCVSSPAERGKANAATVRVFSEVLKFPKTDIRVEKGLRSRDKILRIKDIDIGDESRDEFLTRIRGQLEGASQQK